jgi:hypothetical protein
MTFLFRQHENMSVNNKANSPNHLWEQNMKHNYYCFVASLTCDKTFNRASALLYHCGFLFLQHQTLTLLWCKPSNVRDKVKAYIPSLVQSGRRDTTVLILDLGNRWEGGGGHTTHSQFIPKKESRYSPWRRLDGPQGQHEWEWWIESLAPLGSEPPSVIPTTLCRILKPSKL